MKSLTYTDEFATYSISTFDEKGSDTLQFTIDRLVVPALLAAGYSESLLKQYIQSEVL